MGHWTPYRPGPVVGPAICAFHSVSAGFLSVGPVRRENPARPRFPKWTLRGTSSRLVILDAISSTSCSSSLSLAVAVGDFALMEFPPSSRVGFEGSLVFCEWVWVRRGGRSMERRLSSPSFTIKKSYDCPQSDFEEPRDWSRLSSVFRHLLLESRACLDYVDASSRESNIFFHTLLQNMHTIFC